MAIAWQRALMQSLCGSSARSAPRRVAGRAASVLRRNALAKVPDHELSPPPETWAPARRAARSVLGPLDHYLRIEATSGVVLIAATLVALVWANSPWARAYTALWDLPLTIGIGGMVFEKPLHFFINDVLMTIFFFSAGLEIRRELSTGSLADPRRAALPIAAAIGGMIVPALVFTIANRTEPAHRGWGIPMATDIAFAVGVVALLGRRIPPALRVLLLALAIIDDIGAIVVIAVFYSSGVVWTGLLVAAGGMAAILAFQTAGFRRPLLYVAPGIIVWVGLYVAHVHPTIAGVAIGLATPVRAWFGNEGFVRVAEQVLAEVRGTSSDDELLPPLRQIRIAQREAIPPVVRVQASLHHWVAYGIMPLFALANAGVTFGGGGLGAAPGTGVLLGAAVGLLLGKPLGIVAATLASVRLGLCRLPDGLGWRDVLILGVVAGVGFTMAIFIAGLAFEGAPDLLAAAKLGVLLGSGLAGATAYALGRLAKR